MDIIAKNIGELKTQTKNKAFTQHLFHEIAGYGIYLKYKRV
jgi:hypothetical protein